jgi:hypothetical protein
MERCANNTTLGHDFSFPYTLGGTEAISQITEELFCNDTLRPFYLAAVRDEDIGDDKLWEQLRYHLKSLGLFIGVENRALCKFAEALQDEMISNGIARAVVAYAQEVISMEGKTDEEPCAGSLASTGELVADVPATTTNRTRTYCIHPTFNLSPTTAHAILDLGAYITVTPPLIALIQHSKRCLSLHSHLLDLVFTTYAQRLLTAIGPNALGEDGQTLHWSRLQTTIAKSCE